MTDPRLPTRTEGEDLTLDIPEGLSAFSQGQVLGERYQILEMLGRGGMGEVWHAFDLKLRVDVALKALRPDFFKSERRLEMLRDEVRAAREVMSPNVCRIFDLIEIEGRELVSMEYVDGATLLGVLQERGPLDLKEAQDIASQFLAGLEAIHKVGLVHRDIKPENIMLTRAGRVVVMDFGLARQETEGGGSVSGTPAYMAPEQAAGQQLDARADVYAAGVVLAEMVSPDGIKSYESRQSLWEGVRSEPAKLPDSPWAPVLKKAVAKDREGRYNTARTLTRALEDVTLRVEGAEDLHPYPGLASFTEDDAEYFFGREAEVEQMWRRLEGPARMLAIMGPSGAGKSSFIAAGLVANVPPGWGIIRSTPGNAAIPSLAGVVAREMAGDPDAVELLPRFDDADVAVQVFAHWGRKNAHSLLVIDQFEELFTQNAIGEQRRFAGLLNRLVLEADVHVLLSMRDDFAAGCHAHESLRPIFHDLTVLDSPTGGNLRRAMVQPAQKCGYRFEDDELVEEMLSEVEGERGALPLLAFALARLWDQRDRETGLLTRQAYNDIGGVGGALARHAEATIDRIGSDRIAIVRELFRNLVTAEGTRAVREWSELLSVFSDSRSESPEEVLRELIDARLLTSYEVRVEDEEPTRMVEIIHESLLANWPRLVGWQTQDADSVRLRDELRQAARAWDEHDRSKDRLWTGTAFREYELWRGRYPGGLTKTEEDFARAMTTHAKRLKHRRRIVVTASFIALLTVLGVVGVSRQQAIDEADRAEAARLVALGMMRFEVDRSEALAHAIASLERADTQDGRKLALRALWAGPPAMVLPELPTPGLGPVSPGQISPFGIAISPDGRFLAAGYRKGVLRVFPRDGGEPLTLQAFDEDQGFVIDLDFSSDSRHLVGGSNTGGGEARVWETDEWRLVRAMQSPEPPEHLKGPQGWSVSYGQVEPGKSSALNVTFQFGSGEDASTGHWLLRRWPLDGGPSESVGRVPATLRPLATLDLSRGRLVAAFNKDLHLHSLNAIGREPLRVVGRHPARFTLSPPAFNSTADLLAVCDQSKTLRVWPLDGDGLEPERELKIPDCGTVAFSPDDTQITCGSRLWDLVGPPTTRPLRFGIENTMIIDAAFTPNGGWLATTGYGNQPYRLTLWPLSNHYPRILRSDKGSIVEPIFFHPDGSRVFTSVSTEGGSDLILAWSLTGGSGIEPTVVFDGANVAMDRNGRFLIAENSRGLWKVPLDGGDPAPIEGSTLWGMRDLDPKGRYLAGLLEESREITRVGVLDLQTGELVEPDPPGEGSSGSRFFDPSGGLLVARGGVLSRWDPETRTFEVLIDEGVPFARPIGDNSLVWAGWEGIGYRSILDVENGSRTPLPQAHQQRPSTLVVDPTGSIAVSGHYNGDIRAGSLFSEEVHLLLGHEGQVNIDAISQDGRWIASLDVDGSAYLWPMPDLSEPPFHTLPYDELMAKLKALTNLRVVPDPKSNTGYTVQPDFTAYHGWAEAPEW
jgi:WD40 repeat protein